MEYQSQYWKPNKSTLGCSNTSFVYKMTFIDFIEHSLEGIWIMFSCFHHRFRLSTCWSDKSPNFKTVCEFMKSNEGNKWKTNYTAVDVERTNETFQANFFQLTAGWIKFTSRFHHKYEYQLRLCHETTCKSQGFMSWHDRNVPRIRTPSELRSYPKDRALIPFCWPNERNISLCAFQWNILSVKSECEIDSSTMSLCSESNETRKPNDGMWRVKSEMRPISELRILSYTFVYVHWEHYHSHKSQFSFQWKNMSSVLLML